jgi:hypothetical protein
MRSSSFVANQQGGRSALADPVGLQFPCINRADYYFPVTFKNALPSLYTGYAGWHRTPYRVAGGQWQNGKILKSLIRVAIASLVTLMEYIVIGHKLKRRKRKRTSAAY